MRSFRTTQKTIVAAFLVLEFFITNALVASAAGGGGGGGSFSASQMAAELEARYHVNLGSAQNQGELFNVSDTKKLAPEVSLFFNPSDPKEGEKITARAFPIYFTNTEASLYYGWYLKRKGCDLKKNVTNEETLDRCNASDPNRGTDQREKKGDITVEDWKIEATRIIAQNGYAGPSAPGTPLDDDGYKAKYGGDNKTNTPDHCYVNDAQSGINYELGGGSNTSFTCPTGTSPVCMANEEEVTQTGGTFEFNATGNCVTSGLPACSSSGVPTCDVGYPRCVADPETTTSCGTALAACSTDTTSSAAPYCRHLFPNAKGKTIAGDSVSEISGDGKFNEKEEKFWGTDQADPDTADNGNKDEANVVGLGNSTFTWNYAAGDKVGVAVEGTSIISTKHDDSSYMIMWAFSKKDCPISLASGKGEYTKTIKGYSVKIPTADFDLNKCIERNLVDPTKGGQSTNMEVAVTATPNNPVNDESGDNSGDIVIVQASVSNAQRNLTDMVFDWTVEASNNAQFTPASTADVTDALRKANLIGNTKGNALDNIRLKLDFDAKTIAPYVDANRIGYLRFKVTVTENFASDITRKGKSDVIVKFTSSGKKISAYTAAVVKPSANGQPYKVVLPGNTGAICTGDFTKTPPDILDRTACRVVKSEIVGLSIDPTGLSSFYWTVNGRPLTCSKSGVSPDCEMFDGVEKPGQQNEVNFLPITGNPGDVYTVTVTANDVTSGNTLTLTRAFHVVEPTVAIESLDKNVAWPKFLGQYKDITGAAVEACPDGLCNDYSTSIFQAFSGDKLGFRAKFIPSFLGSIAVKEWTVDGEAVVEDPVGEIHFTASKPASGIYNIGLLAQAVAPDDIRRALSDIWNISPFDSPEINFSTTAQVELQEPGITGGPLQGPRKYFAAIASYIPGSVIFTFRIFLSAALALFALNFLYATLQDRRMRDFVASIPDKPL
ncbi:MAG: hypothetical protein WAW00_00720 [Candidatus Moraniibacteriota bacterium]